LPACRLARGTGSLVTLDVSINGRIVRALLDTRAATKTMNIDAAGRFGITAAELAASRIANSRGADASAIITHVFRIQNIAVGATARTNFPPLIGPAHIPFADTMLGIDFFRAFSA
jgi:predicted aspartyl protease